MLHPSIVDSYSASRLLPPRLTTTSVLNLIGSKNGFAVCAQETDFRLDFTEAARRLWLQINQVRLFTSTRSLPSLFPGKGSLGTLMSMPERDSASCKNAGVRGC